MSQQNLKRCPNCQQDNDIDSMYCGNCRYVFTRHGMEGPTDIRPTPTTPVEHFIDTTIPTLYPNPTSPKKRNIIRVVFYGALGILIIGALIVGINLGKTTSSTGNTTTLGSNTTAVSGTTPQSNTPTVEIPTATIAQSTVPYVENGSDNWQGWVLSDPWKVIASQQLLVNPSGADSNAASAIAPVSVNGGQAFAVSATIQITNGRDGGVGVVACLSTQGTSYSAVVGYNVIDQTKKAYVYGANGELASVDFNPGNNWDTYRLEVRGNDLTFKINGTPIVHTTDPQFLTCGNQVGLFCKYLSVEVKDFKVELL